MLELIWRAVYREWKKADLTLDPSFEAMCLFALLGLVLSCLLLDLDVSLMPPSLHAL
jgi:hypothetical protein